MTMQVPRSLSLVIVFVAILTLSGCASTRNIIAQARMGPGQKLDPWESWNRKVFAFNDGLDQKVLKPVAIAYRDVVPGPVRQAVDNVFNNVADGWSAVNLLLQGRWSAGVQNTMHFAINSVLGVGGLIDLAGEAGMERRSEDLGKTFGHWGFKTGAYIVWPLFGPSSVRDTFAMPLDRLASPGLVFNDGKTQLSIFALQTVNTRANYLRATDMLEQIALDKYTFIRDAYLFKRGSISEDDDEEDLQTESRLDRSAPDY